MKNLWIIPTDKKPIKGDLLLRHLWKGTPLECISWWRYNETTTLGDTVVYSTLNGSFVDVPSSFKNQNIYITNSEAIKEGVEQWYLDKVLNKPYNSGGAQYSSKQDVIIMTTDQDLIKDDVQAIDDEFLEWFVKNPSCEKVEVKLEIGSLRWSDSKNTYKIIIPKEKQTVDEYEQQGLEKHFYELEPKQETLEAAENNYPEGDVWNVEQAVIRRLAFMRGAKWQSDRMYSEEDMKKAFEAGKKGYMRGSYLTQEYYFTWNNFKSWFEQFKKK